MLSLRNVRLRRGTRVLFEEASIAVFRGDKVGIVGRNGSGKSSLLALIRGELAPDLGEYSAPSTLRIAIVEQSVPDSAQSVLEYVREGDIVLVHTGRDALYDDPGYMAYGPGVTAAATHWLYDRGVRVMGIDAWGWDRPLWMQAQEANEQTEAGIFWAAHQAGLAYSQIERLFNLAALPATGFTVSCFPLKVMGASAGPTRAVAIIP